MTGTSILLTTDELKKIRWGETLNKDYFYIPVMYCSELDKGEAWDEETWFSLRYSSGLPPQSLMGYASKVSTEMTLWQAVRRDLEKDFAFPHEKSFAIEEIKEWDTVKTRGGNTLSRILVWVDVREKLNFEASTPSGLHLKWHDEGEDVFNPIEGYFD